MIISRTPYRVSFFGGGTDYPVWYRENGGAVFSTTIDKYCYLFCRYLPPFFEHKHRVVWSFIENVSSISEIRHPVVRSVLQYLEINEGVEIHHQGDLPARSGMGSSSSFTVGLLNALFKLKGQNVSREDLAFQAVKVEQNLLKENVGCQDQLATAFGGLNKISFLKSGEIIVQNVSLPEERLREFQNHLLLLFTGLTRFSSVVAGEQIGNTKNKKTELFAMYQMVDQGIDILKNNKDIAEFGKLLNESWKLKKSLSNSVSTPEIDMIYEEARKSGAIGGKILGAGGGGFMLLFVRPEDQVAVKEKLKKYLFVSFSFEQKGSEIIFNQKE